VSEVLNLTGIASNGGGTHDGSQLMLCHSSGLLRNVVDGGIHGMSPYLQPVGGRFLARQLHAPLGVSATNVDCLVQDHKRQVLQVAAFQERRIVVHSAILIHGHRSQPRTFHGDERHHLMRHVGHFAGGQYPGFG
jgi:hypothetical protein